MALNKKSMIKNLLIQSLTSFQFASTVTTTSLEESLKGIQIYNKQYDNLWKTRQNYVLDDKSRRLLEKILRQAYNKNIDIKYLQSKSIKELYGACCYFENEYCYNHGYTYSMGIMWDENYIDQAQNLINTL